MTKEEKYKPVYNQILSYKGFTGTAEVSVMDNCLYGKIICVDDLISYEGKTVRELKIAFKEAVLDYIDAKGISYKK